MKIIRGALYILSFAVAVFFAVFFNSYYMLLVASGLVLVVALDIILFIVPFGKVSCEISSDRVEYAKGDKCKIFIRLKNTKPFIIYRAEFKLKIKNKFYQEDFISIRTSVPMFIGRKITIPIDIERSGVLNISVEGIQYSDMFNFLKSRSLVEEIYSIIAMPKKVEIEAIEMGMAQSDEIPAANVYLSNEGDVSGYREYRDGDRIKNINWKLYARNEKLYVKEFEKTSAEEAVVLIDMYSKNIDKAIDYLYSLKDLDFTLLWLPCGNEEFKTAYIANREDLVQVILKIFNSPVESVENKGINLYKRLYRENMVLYLRDKMELI